MKLIGRLSSTLLLVGLVVCWLPSASGGEKKKEGKDLLNKADKLTDDDPKDTFQGTNNSPAKVYTIKFKAGKVYTIDLKSNDFDAFLRLEDANKKMLALDDDGGDGLNSRLVFPAPKDGEYRLIATSLDGKNGAYTLTVVEAKAFFAKTDKLTADDNKINNKIAKQFKVKMKAGNTYTITLSSTAFDAYLYLQSPDGNALAENDDGAGNLNSRIVHKADKDGEYRLIASSLSGEGTGDFTLLVVEGSTGAAPRDLPKKE